VALFNEYILRFEVAVHHIVFSQHLQSLHQLRKNTDGSSFVERALALYELMERASFAKLIHKIAIIFGLEQFVEADDVVAGLEHVMNGQLIADVLFDLGVFGEDAIADDFDGVGLSVFEVPRLEDLAVSAAAQQIAQLVFADYSSHLQLAQSGPVFHQSKTKCQL
jgi:hypothetical protein